MKHQRLLKYPILIAIFIIIVFIFLWLADLVADKLLTKPQPLYGLTFSTYYTRQLGLDPQEVYLATLKDLKAKNLRIPIYWNEVEKEEGKFDFGEIDQLFDQAWDTDIKIILAIGYKVPRWPECFAPDWSTDLEDRKMQEKILTLVKATVNHFKDRPEIVAWQVENEPFLNFGLCRMFDESFLKQEVEIVRALDSRPVILTDSGELSLWVTAMKHSDVLGTSLYRIVWNPIFGFFRYPFPPLYYNLKAFLTQKLFAPSTRGVFVSELQAEPWSSGKHLAQTPLTEQIKLFSLKDFQDVVEFTSKTRIKDQYFWGNEWWYWMKKQGYPQYWDFAKKLFHSPI